MSTIPSAAPRPRCGWLVQLNATGRAGERRTDYRDPTTACTNYYCTGKQDHKDHRKRYADNQERYRANIISGTARFVELTDEPLLATSNM